MDQKQQSELSTYFVLSTDCKISVFKAIFCAFVQVINYSGDLLTPPEDNSEKQKPRGKSALTMFGKDQKKTIRGGGIGEDYSSDEDDW